MKLSTNQPDDTPTPPSSKTVLLLLKDIGDVTWRMFIPVLAGIVFGTLLDREIASQPWGVLGGMSLGIVLSVVLVRQVYKKL